LQRVIQQGPEQRVEVIAQSARGAAQFHGQGAAQGDEECACQGEQNRGHHGGAVVWRASRPTCDRARPTSQTTSLPARQKRRMPRPPKGGSASSSRGVATQPTTSCTASSTPPERIPSPARPGVASLAAARGSRSFCGADKPYQAAALRASLGS